MKRRNFILGIGTLSLFPFEVFANDIIKKYISKEEDLEIELLRKGEVLNANTTLKPNAWPFIVGKISINANSQISSLNNTLNYRHILKQNIKTSIFDIGNKEETLELSLDTATQTYHSHNFATLEDRVFSLNDCPCELNNDFILDNNEQPILVDPVSFYWIIPNLLSQFYDNSKQIFFTDGKRLYVTKIFVEKNRLDTYEVRTENYKVGSTLKKFDRFDTNIKIRGDEIIEITKTQYGQSRTAYLLN